jgi:hypothetical protein
MKVNAAAAQIIRHLRVFDESTKLLTFKVEPEVFGKIEQAIKPWFDFQRKQQKQVWYGSFEWNGNAEETVFAPKDWAKDRAAVGDKLDWTSKEVPEAYAYFSIGVRDGDDRGDTENSDYWYLTRLCHVGTQSNSLGFVWTLNEEALGVKGRKAQWKELLRKHAEKLERRGFSYESKDGRLFLPLRIDAEQLANSFESESVDDALQQPLDQCLRIISEAVADFTEVIEEVRTKFSASRGARTSSRAR